MKTLLDKKLYTIDYNKDFNEIINILNEQDDNIFVYTDSSILNIFEASLISKLNNVKVIISDNNDDEIKNDDLVIVIGGGKVYESFANRVLNTVKVRYIFIPTTLFAMTQLSVNDNKIQPEKIYIIFDALNTLDDKLYFDGFSYIMQNSLVKDSIFYTWLIDKMYEICERDEDAVLYMIEKCINIRNLVLFGKEQVLEKDSILCFGKQIANLLYNHSQKDFSMGEFLALGCVTSAFISWKKNWLTMEEYYEIRDMYVPFYLPISIDMMNIEELCDSFVSENGDDENYEFVLLKKIGKTVKDNTVSIAEIKDALTELNFDEAW